MTEVGNPESPSNALATKRTVLLLSGGLDSSSLLYWALQNGRSVFPLLVDYGQITFAGERRASEQLLHMTKQEAVIPLRISNIARLGRGTLVSTAAENNELSEYFPSRNTLLITLGAMYAQGIGADSLMIGLIRDSASSLPDCSPEYLEAARTFFAVEYPSLNIEAPFLTRQKVEVVAEAVQMGLHAELTFCCNRLADHHCWLCSSCTDRRRVLTQLGILS